MSLHAIRRLTLGFVLLWLILIGASFVLRRSSHELRVTFLDVGQGDAIIIETPGGKTLVVDTGNLISDGSDDMGRRVVAPYLRQRGINRVDILILTHPDSDHIGGAATLLTQFPTDLLLENGQFARSDSPLVAPLLETASSRRAKVKSARRGQVLVLGDGVTIRVLAPTPEALPGPENDASIALRIEYGERAFLLTGDASEVEEAELVASGQPLACDVLKVGHHGSLTSTTPEFLAAARPRFAVICVGERNTHGHPRREILERLTAIGAQIYRTDRQGAVTCRTDGMTIQVETTLSPLTPSGLTPGPLP
jgi:competence protein ComEC